jgi:two-component sensor histidine kinase
MVREPSSSRQCPVSHIRVFALSVVAISAKEAHTPHIGRRENAPFGKLMQTLEIDRALAQAIVDTIREPLLVLDADLRVVAASRSYYLKFHAEPQFTQGMALSALGEGQWDLPALRAQLERVAPDKSVVENYEVDLDFPQLGCRTLRLNARKVFYEGNGGGNILLAIEDITERRLVERERDELLRQKDLLLEEMQHRVANSLAIIASILLMKARTVTSAETRAHLEDAHKRVMSVATVQKHLHPSETGATIELSAYLSQLCGSLSGSMINDEFCSIQTRVSEGAVTSSAAVSLGLIVTELVINALKHAFHEDQTGCVVLIAYEVNDTDWKLTVSDNGAGANRDDAWPPLKVGLGSSIVSALAASLDAQVKTQSGPTGTIVCVTHSTFKSLPKAA